MGVVALLRGPGMRSASGTMQLRAVERSALLEGRMTIVMHGRTGAAGDEVPIPKQSKQ